MTVFEVHCKVNDYQCLCLSDMGQAKRHEFYFDCEKREANWTPPEVYIRQPKLKRGNFFYFAGASGCFICDEPTRYHDELAELLETSGELLPLLHEGETFYVMNVLECINALDRDKSEWPPQMKQKIGFPQKYVFHRSRIPDTPLFKIPELSRWQILCVEDGPNAAYDFKRMVERLGLTGLYFEKLWTDKD